MVDVTVMHPLRKKRAGGRTAMMPRRQRPRKSSSGPGVPLSDQTWDKSADKPQYDSVPFVIAIESYGKRVLPHAPAHAVACMQQGAAL